MPIASTFYDTVAGEGVKETTWAQSWPSRGGAPFGVIGSGDFKVTAHPSTAYAVNVAAGKAFGHGIWDEVTGTTVLTTTAPASGALRWDLIALRRDWQPTGGGPSSLVVVRGTTSMVIPAAMEKRPGIVADQPLWLVQWQGGQTSPRQIIDLRCWVGPGGVEIAHVLAQSYLNYPGAAVKLGDKTSYYQLGANNVWSWGTADTGWVDMTLGSTPGVAGVRAAGVFQKVLNAPCQSRIVNGMIQVRGELNYVNTGTPAYEPGEGSVVAVLPASMRPAYQAFILGTTAQYSKTLMYVVNPNGNISLGPGATGKRAQFNGIVPLD